MRLLVGLAAFCAPIVLVLTAAAQTPVADTVQVVMQQVAAVTLRN